MQWIFDDPEDDTFEEDKSGSNSISQSRDFVDIVKRQTQVYELRKQINSGSDTTDQKKEQLQKPNKPGQGLQIGGIRSSNIKTITKTTSSNANKSQVSQEAASQSSGAQMAKGNTKSKQI